MGSPKALLAYKQHTFVENLISVFAGMAEDVIVVVGQDRAEIGERARGARVIVNDQPEQGQISSLRLGLEAVPGDHEGAFFCPVDIPAVDRSTIEALMERANDAAIIVPQYQGKHGHPVLVARSLFDEFRIVGITARDVMHANRPRTLFVDVDDPGILKDVDTPEDYRQLLSSEVSC